jgi:TRAP-type mannitol/chloroaromatic compound transport system permease small subunit
MKGRALVALTLLVATGLTGFVIDAYSMGEISEDPGGLTHRWIIKSMIPVSMYFLLFAAIGYVT